MKWIIAVAVAAAVLHVASCTVTVRVRVGQYEYPLQSVKMLWRLVATARGYRSEAQGSMPAVCYQPALPFTGLIPCFVFSSVNLATRSNSCEICASPACYGC
uniref:Uncharacterized protein n=1 Tax=Gadus morhua TaxID=8049 RepID=A0A8C5A974_GADMO